MAAKKKTSAFIDSLVPITEEKEEFKLSPVPDSLRQIRPTPSTTSPAKPKQDFKLDPGFIPAGEVRPFTDDELFRKIEGNLEYSPTDAELDKYLNYKEQNPTGAVDFIKGAWDGAWGVLGEIGSGAKAIASEPLKSLDFFTAEGWERKAANISEAVARSTWDLGVLGREFNEMFGRLRDDELREEMKEMKLRQANPDYRMKGAMGGEAYLSPEQKESLRKTFAVDYIKERISDDLDDIEETTDNFQKPVDQLKREFARRGLTYVEDATKRDYTTANYIDNILDDKQRKKLVDDFPNWMRGRQRDRWRRTRYMQKISERARRGDQTIIGEFFGPEFDEKFRKVVNPQVATLLSYAGGPPEVAGALATRIPRKGLTAGAALTDPIQTAPTLGGKATELAGKALRKGGEKVEQLGDYIVETPQRAAGVGALLGAAASRDLSGVPAGALAGAVEQRVGVISSAGRALQSAGETAQAIGEVVGRPGGTEGILKAASRVAPTEETAKKLNTISFLDPAINLASDLGKGAATGSFVGLALAAPSEDAGVMGAGFGGGLTGGFVGAGAGRFLTKGALLRNQQQNDWEQFRQRLSPKQIESIKKYAPDINTMGQVMSQVRMLEGVLTPESRGNVDFDFLSPQEFINRFGAARGVVVTGNRVKPEIIINTGWRGPNSLFHEAWHAMKRFAGTTEQVKVAGEGKQEQPVLQPYLRKIQTILFGEELGGQQVVKGLYDKKTILNDFADQYTDKMTDEQKAKWEDSFKQDPVTKEKFTPEQAEQNKLNYLMEELEAESFRYLMSGSDPRGIASGQRSITQKFVDHMLLAEHSKTLRGMKKALSSVGIRFKGSGEPSDIFTEKDSKGRWRGLTNSPELNAALRDYVRAWEGLQYRTRYIDDVEPSGFQIGGQGVAGSRVVEFQLRKPENNFLREHFKSSDIIKKNAEGEPVLMPDGVTLQLLSEGQIRKLQEDRAELVKKALEDTEDPNGMTSEVNEKGEVSFKGVPTPRQLDAIDTIPSNILTPNQKQIIREVSTMMADDPGAPLQFLYNAAIGRGKRYSSSLSSSHRIAVPLGFHVSKAKNFYFTSLDLGAYHNKLKAWADDTKKALHKGGHKLALWDKDVKAFEADLFKYLENHKNGRPGDTGLAPDQKTAEQKRNVLNDFFNINKGEDAQGTQSNFNPIAAARRAVDPKTGKQKKRAYRNLENLIRSYRLDRVLDEDFGKSLSYSLGKPLPMKSQEDFYRRQLENFMALPNQQQGARFMPPPAPTTPQFKRFFEGSKVVDDKGEPLVVYSGHGNTELYGTKYDKNKGTSGGFYATEDPAVASSYAKGKMGGREFYEDGSEYRFKYKNGNWGKKIWQIELTPEQQAKAKQFLKEEAGFDIDKYWQENARYDRDANRARLTGGVRRLSNIHKFMETMGDTIKYADETDKPVSEMTPYEVIENQGVSRFEDLLNEIGIEWNAFDKRQPGVFPLYLSIKNPIDAGKPFPQDVLTALKKSASRERPKFEGEYWTKDLSMKEFVNEIEKGSEYWSTQVPTKAKKIFQEFGYDGIKELGNKKGDGERQVNWIAFEPEQIKSVLNRGEFSPENPDIRFMPAPAENRSSKVNNIESEISKTVESEKNKISVERLPEDNFDSDAFSEETLVSANGIDVSASIFKRKDSDLYEISYSKWGEEDRGTAKTLNEAIKQAKEEIGIEVEEYHSDVINRYERGDLLQDIKLPENWEVDDIVTSGGGSVYYKLRENVEFDADGDVVDYNEYKVRIADHDASPFREREFGENDFDVEVSDLSARELDRAIGDVEVWAERRSRGEIENLRFMPQPTFYSKAERAVEGAKAGIFNKEGMTSVGQAKALLEKNAPETELEWSGVLDYLDLQKEEGNKVSKQDLLSYLKNNGVEVEEVLRSSIGAKLEAVEKSNVPDTLNNIYEIYRADDPEGDIYGSLGQLTEAAPEVTPSKYGADRPFTLRLSAKNDTLTFKTLEEADQYIQGVVSETLFAPTEKFAGGPAALPGGENYSELVLKLPERSPEDTFYVPSGHRFPEQNILAHIRFTERTDADGKRMLFLDEVQSDWNTEGRKEGFNKPMPAKAARDLKKLEDEKRRLVTKYGAFNHPEIREIDTQIRNLEFENQPVVDGVPNMPYKGSKWQDLVMKRMIRWAADNGYDRLGWITGKDTADRYDLSKAVDEIKYIPEQQRLIASRGEYGKQSYERVVDKDQVTPESLESYIGKDLAKKLIESPEKESGVEGEGDIVKTRVLSGKDLQISPAWAENLYDKSLPKIARKLTKKKGAVGRVGIYGSNGKLNGALAKNGIKPKYEANYVDISPEVKELAQEGFSYFMPEGRGGAASAPVQAAAPQPPSGVIIPKVKLTEDEKEESRKLLQQLLD